ncbi:MAG: hypothetical protein MUF72_23980 [Elainella sp. Prado103]|jgi:hypothetical protein|nr:hypothetical protein [Elainella sp. Prado103]
MLCLIGVNAIGYGMVGCRPQRSFGAETSLSELPPVPVVVDPIDRDVPYVPTPEPVVAAMLRLAQVTENDLIYDLGSGDGRVVITAAQNCVPELAYHLD